MFSCSGYWPPEFIDRGIISKKYDIFSLGVIIMKIIVGLEGYSSIADIDAGGCFDYVRIVKLFTMLT
jgi:hypothetical protein